MPAYSFDVIANGYRRFFLFLFTTSEPANLEIFFDFFFRFWRNFVWKFFSRLGFWLLFWAVFPPNKGFFLILFLKKDEF